MRTEAIADARTLSYRPADPFGVRIRTMRDLMRTASLAYILDPRRRMAHKNKIRDTLSQWEDLKTELSAETWERMVLPGAAFFTSVLALDIVHDELAAAERVGLETTLDTVAEWYWQAPVRAWPPHVPAVRGIWGLYRADRPRIEQAKQEYLTAVLSQLSPSGIPNPGPGYGVERLAGNDRNVKAYFLDVLDFTGEDRSLFADAQMRSFIEWLASASCSPSGGRIVFADTANQLTDTPRVWLPALMRADRFSPDAGRHAAWHHRGAAFEGELLSYLFYARLSDRGVPPAEPPRSRIWTDMASFWPADVTGVSLMGALWNPRNAESHSHKDVNAIFLAAYGAHVLSNSGWALGSAYESYSKEEAEANNTVLIDGVNHVRKAGAGISEGFTAVRLDYASGDSGRALPNGRHTRNFVFVHPQDGVEGYFVLFDEVMRASDPAATASVMLHPVSASFSIVTPMQEYRWAIQSPAVPDVHLSVFLGTVPTTVELRDGYLAPVMTGTCLCSTYALSAAGDRRIVTVLFPHKPAHPKAVMSRLAGSDFSGVRMEMRAVVDIALESSGVASTRYGRVSFWGRAALYRTAAESIRFYFLRNGRSFDSGEDARQGFDADAEVSLYMSGREGKVVSPGTAMTFHHPMVEGVRLGGTILPPVSGGAGWVTVAVPAGTHDVALVGR